MPYDSQCLKAPTLPLETLTPSLTGTARVLERCECVTCGAGDCECIFGAGVVRWRPELEGLLVETYDISKRITDPRW
jgi:hypothetical protein